MARVAAKKRPDSISVHYPFHPWGMQKLADSRNKEMEQQDRNEGDLLPKERLFPPIVSLLSRNLLESPHA